jgi:hypothetical protein
VFENEAKKAAIVRELENVTSNKPKTQPFNSSNQSVGSPPITWRCREV